MPNKKKKKEIIADLELENQQLRAALIESHKYADKLVNHIPYLPADIKNLRNANEHYVQENMELHKEIYALREKLYNSEAPEQIIHSEEFAKALTIADEFLLPEEFPGPYTLQSDRNGFKIFCKAGDVIAKTEFNNFAHFFVNILNALDKHTKGSIN